jgi:hypothetical protein
MYYVRRKFISPALEARMRISLSHTLRTAFLFTAMAAASVFLQVTAQAESGFRRAIPADVAGARMPAVLVNIDKTNQTMTVFLGGAEKYIWPVSTGRPGYSTPSGIYTATSMNEIWYSKQWDNAPMPHSVFFIRDGHAIHGSFDLKNLGRPVSHGCVRIAPKNAATLYALVKEHGLANTQVVVTGVSPGGEYGAAGAQQESPHGVAGAQASPRPSFFGPLFGNPFESQGR